MLKDWPRDKPKSQLKEKRRQGMDGRGKRKRLQLFETTAKK